jgi:thiol-disulfide isomerase/thioredoxin
MWSRLSVVVGLLAGVATAALIIGGIVTLAPDPVPTPTPPPTAPASPPATAGPPTATGSPAASPQSGLFGIGEPAPPLVVPQVGGGTIDLAALKGTPVWVNFMGTYCPPCIDEFPLMNGYAARHADDDLVILAIDVKEDEGTVAAFAERLGAIFPLGLDEDGSAAERWGAIALPVHFWIDRDGIIRDAALGGIGPDLMSQGVRSILPDVTVEP